MKQRRNRPWSERIQDGVRNSWLAWWEWRKSGAPMDLAAESYKNMRLARKVLRKEQ